MKTMKPSDSHSQYLPCVHQSEFFYSLRQQESKPRYRAQCRGDTSRSAKEREQTLSLPYPNGSSEEAFEKVCAGSGELEKKKGMEKEVEEKRNVPESCITFAENALQVASTEANKEAERMMHVILESVSDSYTLGRYVKIFEECERILEKNNNKNLGKKGFVEKIKKR